MRTMKVLTVLGLLLAISMPASALTLAGGYAGKIEMKFTNWDMGRVYDLGQSATTIAGVDALTVSGGLGQDTVAGTFVPGGDAGEDGWFIFRITTIQTPGGIPLWQTDASATSHGMELVGIGYGITDVATDNTGATTYTFSTSTKIDMWEQPYGNFTESLGSSGRIGGAAYTGIGTPGGVAGATLIASTVAFGGIDIPAGSPIVPGAPFEQAYTLPGPQGTTYTYVDVVGGTWGDGNMNNGELVSGAFLDPISAANFDVAEGLLETKAVAYIPTGGATDNWLFKTQDPFLTTYAVPEPITMLALFGGVAGLGGYIRKRRMA